jgi:hypothetical protein
LTVGSSISARISAYPRCAAIGTGTSTASSPNVSRAALRLKKVSPLPSATVTFTLLPPGVSIPFGVARRKITFARTVSPGR